MIARRESGHDDVLYTPLRFGIPCMPEISDAAWAIIDASLGAAIGGDNGGCAARDGLMDVNVA